MLQISSLIKLADAYKAGTGIPEDTTVSHRLFRDSKKLGALRKGTVDITVGRFNEALRWFARNWPSDVPQPPELAEICGETHEE